MDEAQATGGPRLAVIAGICVAVFAATSVVAAVGYASWMWVFVFAGLVLPPIVLVLASATALMRRLSPRP